MVRTTLLHAEETKVRGDVTAEETADGKIVFTLNGGDEVRGTPESFETVLDMYERDRLPKANEDGYRVYARVSEGVRARERRNGSIRFTDEDGTHAVDVRTEDIEMALDGIGSFVDYLRKTHGTRFAVYPNEEETDALFEDDTADGVRFPADDADAVLVKANRDYVPQNDMKDLRENDDIGISTLSFEGEDDGCGTEGRDEMHVYVLDQREE